MIDGSDATVRKVKKTRPRNATALLSKKHPIYAEVKRKLEAKNKPKPKSDKPLNELLIDKMNDDELASLLVKRAGSNPTILKMLTELRGYKGDIDTQIIVRPIDYSSALELFHSAGGQSGDPPTPQNPTVSKIDVSDSKTVLENEDSERISQDQPES